MNTIVNATKVTNKTSFNGREMVHWEMVTLPSGATVAFKDGKLMPSEEAIKLRGMSDMTYTFTCICQRRGTNVVIPEGLHIPKRRK